MGQYELEFSKLYDEISATMITTPLKNEVLLALNKALRRMNTIMTPEKKIILISGSQADTTIGDMTTLTIGELTDYKIKEYTRFAMEFSYDSDAYSLRIDDSITRVNKIFLDDEEWENWSYETVKNTSNADQHIYHFDGRYIYFPKDIGASTETIKMMVEMIYPEIEEDLVLVPKTYHSLLVDGATYFLMMIPKYRDTNQYASYFKEIRKNFYDGIEEMEQKNFELEPRQNTPKEFIYQNYSKYE
ncbi:MAG: hypothetical protein KAH32_04565 [Chlamydiia bacterium]|nr:hypothetical protein [Chlamydiia bacterium]